MLSGICSGLDDRTRQSSGDVALLFSVECNAHYDDNAQDDATITLADNALPRPSCSVTSDCSVPRERVLA